MAGELGKNSLIEMLRATAIVYTLVHHLAIPTGHIPTVYIYIGQLGLFHIGVDLFFVISGFVITRSLCGSEMEFQVSRWRLMMAFWLKRVFRLLPLAWLWLLISAVYTVTMALLPGSPDQHGFLLAPQLAAFLNIANLYSAYCFRAGASQILCDVPNISAHYWSLSLEEQFYLLYPLLFFLFNRKFLIIVLCMAVLAQFFWSRPTGSYGWYFRTDALYWGVLLGFFANTSLYEALGRILLRYRYGTLATMAVLILLLPALAAKVEVFGGDPNTYGVATIALVCAVIVFIASYDFKCFGNTSVIYRVLMYLGSRSYSLYVVHFIFFVMIGNVSSKLGLEKTMFSDFSLIILALLATFTASELSYRYVESRYRPKGRQLAKQFLNR